MSAVTFSMRTWPYDVTLGFPLAMDQNRGFAFVSLFTNHLRRRPGKLK